MNIWIEILGYTGMALVILSFLFKRVMILRSVNLFGAILSMTYGFLTSTYPTAALNATLAVINIIFITLYLVNKYKKPEEELVENSQ